jgi:hypothetical protein
VCEFSDGNAEVVSKHLERISVLVEFGS